MPSRCVRGWSCSTASDPMVPSGPAVTEARSVLAPSVRSHSCAQPRRSRPDDRDQQAIRSSRPALPPPNRRMKSVSPARSASSPISAASCLITAAPLE